MSYFKERTIHDEYFRIFDKFNVSIIESKKFDDYYTLKLQVEIDELSKSRVDTTLNVKDNKFPETHAKDYVKGLFIEKYYVESDIEVKSPLFNF